MKYKPSFILLDFESQKQGMNAINKFFVETKGFDLDTVRTLVVKYPYILGKTIDEFEQFFNIMKSKELSEEETMRILLECPKLVSKDLDKQMKEIFFLFNLYHGISEKEVMGIFQGFPYLFCCELQKIQRFMGEFRKYRYTKEQIIKLVNHNIS